MGKWKGHGKIPIAPASSSRGAGAADADSRHHFIYVVPQSDPDAGKTIDMRLMNENTVYLWMGGPTSETEAPPQIWHRCLPSVSFKGAADLHLPG